VVVPLSPPATRTAPAPPVAEAPAADAPRRGVPAWAAPAVLVVATVVAAVVRLAGLGRNDLWIDEAYTLGLTQHGLREMLALFAREANGIAYQLVVFPLAQVDDSVTALRMPAAIAGILTVPALYWAGGELLGRRAGLGAAVLMAVSPLAVVHSQDARPIIFVALFATVSVGCLARATRSPRAVWWLLYALATVLVFFSNLTAGVILLLPHLVLVLLRGRAAVRRWLAWLGAIAVMLVPLAVLIAMERSRRDPLYWLEAPSVGDVAGGVRTLFGGAVVVAVVAAMAVAVAVRRRRRAAPGGGAPWRDPLVVVAVWALAPPLVLAAASLVTPLFLPRYAIAAVPGMCLLAGGLAARLPLPVACAALAVMALAMGRQVVEQHDATQTEWRRATAALQAAREQGDPVIFDTGSGLGPAGYYDAALAAPDGSLVIGEWRNEPVPDGVVLLDDPGGYGRTAAGPPDATLVARLARRTGRLHVVLSSVSPAQGDVERRAGLAWAARRCTVDAERFVGVSVLHISGCPEGAAATPRP